MRQLLKNEQWIGLREAQYLDEGVHVRYDFPHTIDMQSFEGIEICYKDEKKSHDGEEIWLKLVLYPLSSGRPEFIESTEAEFLLPSEKERIFVPFSVFHHSQLVHAHMKYISHMELVWSGSQEKQTLQYPIKIKSISLAQSGDFHVNATKCAKVGETGERIVWEMELENESDVVKYITLHQEYAGRECLQLEYPKKIMLHPNERKRVDIATCIPKNMPPGGYEKSILHWIPDGDGAKKQTVELYAAKAVKHPWILHQEDGWKRLAQKVAEEEQIGELFQREYVQKARMWQVPEPNAGKGYVYESVSQHPFLATAIAWKVTGEDSFLQKILQYLQGFLEEERGYLATEYSYFQFIESLDEYKKGTFPVHRACSAGWVQEAEFMTKVAIVYDLLYDRVEVTEGMHQKMENCMRSYMAFEDWRLTDGDGNNFQIAEASAALYCACLLQDYPMMNRFLAGTNGLYELMGSVFSDDGSYFEGASGYMRLAAELFLQAAIAMEHFGVNLKDMIVQASFDDMVIHAPWAVRTKQGQKPFLGMSFERACKVERPVRKLQDYMDNLLQLVNQEGIMFSNNDSNEQSLVQIMEMAYYLYRDDNYLKIAKINGHEDLLYGKHMIEQTVYEPGVNSFYNQGNGLAVLRDKGEHRTQVVMKYGQHGGYHGHFDKLSLLSYIKDNCTFHNQEYTWYGYDSFLFKMWVQNSLAHNMVVVDGRMQEPTKCECIYYEENENFHAVCAQTLSRWSDPPYGGQTPYPLKFPQEKCQKEKRYILMPEEGRRQGEIGEYSEPIFQRRLVILAEGCCFVWDYEEAKEEHCFDCLYHPLGSATIQNLEQSGWEQRFDENPYGAGQFIMNCHWFTQEGTAKLHFVNAKRRVNPNDVIDFVSNTQVFGVYPQKGEVMVARYPQRGDSFETLEDYLTDNLLEDTCKKVVAFRQKGHCARFVTALEIGNEAGKIESICCEQYESIVIHMRDGSKRQLTVTGMDSISEEKITVTYCKIAK